MNATATQPIRCSACAQPFATFTALAEHVRTMRGTDVLHPLHPHIPTRQS